MRGGVNFRDDKLVSTNSKQVSLKYVGRRFLTALKGKINISYIRRPCIRWSVATPFS